MYAVRGEQPEAVKFLIQAGAGINIKTNSGDTALIQTTMTGQAEIIKLLLQHGANVNESNNNGETALLQAAKWGEEEIVKLLLAAKIDIQDNEGYTAVDYADARKHKEVVDLLLNAGAIKKTE